MVHKCPVKLTYVAALLTFLRETYFPSVHNCLFNLRLGKTPNFSLRTAVVRNVDRQGPRNWGGLTGHTCGQRDAISKTRQGQALPPTRRVEKAFDWGIGLCLKGIGASDKAIKLPLPRRRWRGVPRGRRGSSSGGPSCGRGGRGGSALPGRRSAPGFRRRGW